MNDATVSECASACDSGKYQSCRWCDGEMCDSGVCAGEVCEEFFFCGRWEQVVGDATGGGNGFGDANNGEAWSMAVFRDDLYVGTYNDDDGCEAWRSSDGTTWQPVVGAGADVASGFSDADNWGTFSMTAFGGYLYLGTNNESAGCEVWRSSDGTAWEPVVGDPPALIGNGFDDPDNTHAFSMAVFAGDLYAGTYKETSDCCEVWRSSDGIIWSQVNTDGFGDADNLGAVSTALFGGYLYAGTMNPNGCEVWRSSDGTTWEPVVGDTGVVGNGFDDPNNWAVASMAVLGSYLYVGTWNAMDACEVWRSSDGTTWEPVVGGGAAVDNGFGDAYSAHAFSTAVFGSDLYVGTSNWSDGCEVWRSSDGTTWNQINTDGFGDAYNNGALSMAVFWNSLYVGTGNNTDGCEVWRSSVEPIPTVSEWGLIVMTLLLVTLGTIVFGPRRRPVAA